jgi:hypothetical protein
MVPNGGVYIGDMYGGKILKLARGGTDDCTYGVISPAVRSTPSDRGAPGRYKLCKSLAFTFKAPQTHMGKSFSGTIKYSDDGGSTWSSTRTIAATITSGLKQYVVKEYNFGRYLNRQWQYDFSTSSDISLGPVIEEYDIL